MARFYKVQIPHRGRIPGLNRNGPIACIGLNTEQCAELIRKHNLVLCDPETGNPYDQTKFLNEIVVRKIADDAAEFCKKHTFTFPQQPEKTDPTPDGEETKIEVYELTKTEEDEPKSEPDQTPSETVTTDIVNDTEDDSDDSESESAANEQLDDKGFDHTKIVCYSKLSKSKKRELRAAYSNMKKNGEVTDADYATLNTMANELLEKK